jgi:hypothetical protein
MLQLDFFESSSSPSSSLSASPIVGTKVRLSKACTCGSYLGTGGPHANRVTCDSCAVFRQWLGHREADFITEVSAKFGCPTSPVILRGSVCAHRFAPGGLRIPIASSASIWTVRGCLSSIWTGILAPLMASPASVPCAATIPSLSCPSPSPQRAGGICFSATPRDSPTLAATCLRASMCAVSAVSSWHQARRGKTMSGARAQSVRSLSMCIPMYRRRLIGCCE